MLYLLWHVVIALALALLLYRPRGLNPHGLHVVTVVFGGVLPDLDHLLAWDPKYLLRIFPWHLWEGLTFAFRSPVSSAVLHLWVWPLSLLVVGLLAKERRFASYLLAVGVGWGLHLVLDGVVAIL